MPTVGKSTKSHAAKNNINKQKRISKFLDPSTILNSQSSLPSLIMRKQIRRSIVQNSNNNNNKTQQYGLRKIPERSEHYNQGYVIGGPLFVIGKVAEFASQIPNEILYVAEDGSIQGFQKPEGVDENDIRYLSIQNEQLAWQDNSSFLDLRRETTDQPQIKSRNIDSSESDLYLETDSNQCVMGPEPSLLRFWNQIHPKDNDSYMLVGGAFLQIQKSGIYEIDIHLTVREQTSTIGKRCLLLNLLPASDPDNNDEEQPQEQSIILLEQQPPSDIDADNIMFIMKVVALEEGDTISLSFHIIEGVDEDISCVLPNSLWVIKLVAETNIDRVCTLNPQQ